MKRFRNNRIELLLIFPIQNMNLPQFFDLVKKSVNAWIDDYAPSMGAAISYYTVFSIAPLLIIVVAVAGLVWGREAVQGELAGQLASLMGKDGAAGVQALVESANQPAKGIIATVISIAMLVIGATTVFAELQSSLDRIWKVTATKNSTGILGTLRARLLSLGFVLGLGFLLAVSLVISAAVAAFGGWAEGQLPGWTTVLQVINTGVSFSLAMVLFGMIFKLMPQARVAWRDVWIGAFVTGLLFEVGKAMIGLYLGKSTFTSSYAAAGSLVVLLVWVYYSAQIFLLGAEFTWVYANAYGSRAKEGRPVAVTAAERLATQTPAQVAAMPPSQSVPNPKLTAARMEQRAAHPFGPSRHNPSFKQKVAQYAALKTLEMIVLKIDQRQAEKARVKRLGLPTKK